MLFLLTACMDSGSGADQGSITNPFGRDDTSSPDDTGGDTGGPDDTGEVGDCPIMVYPGDSIVEALANRGGCEEVLVFDGTWDEAIELEGAIVFRGSDATLSGSLLITGDATVEGFRLADGGGLSGDYGHLDEGETYGGGLFVYKAAPTIRDNVIEGNRAYQGGGAYLYEFDGVFEGNLLRDNESVGDTSWGGGGLYCYRCEGSFTGNSFEDNSHAPDSGSGGAVMIRRGSPSFDRNRFSSNRAEGTGGCIRSADAEPVITNNLLVDCHPDAITVSYEDGGLVAHNTILSSARQGLRIHCPNCSSGPTTEIVNNLIVGSVYYGAKATGPNSVEWSHNALWDNGSGDYDGIEGSSDLLVDPLLDEEGRPAPESPLIDAGLELEEVTSDLEDNARPGGDGWDIGAYEL